MPNDECTPIPPAILEIKRDYPTTILSSVSVIYYETFDEDRDISRETGYCVNSRPIGQGVRAPLAGIPYHAVEIPSPLIEKGYHLQSVNRSARNRVKGLFSRKVVRGGDNRYC